MDVKPDEDPDHRVWEWIIIYEIFSNKSYCQ